MVDICIYAHYTFGLVHQRDAIRIFNDFPWRRYWYYDTFRRWKNAPNNGLYLSSVNRKPGWFMTVIKEATEYAFKLHWLLLQNIVPSQCLASLLLLDVTNTFLICYVKAIMLLWNQFLFFPSDRSLLPSRAIASTKCKNANNQAKVSFPLSL